jgi:hypothetical protein
MNDTEELDVAPGSRSIPEWRMDVSAAKRIRYVHRRGTDKRVGRIDRMLENRDRVVVAAAVLFEEYFGNDAPARVVPLADLEPAGGRFLTDLAEEQAAALPTWGAD